MDYVATYLDAYICYHASDMILDVHSDAAYYHDYLEADSRSQNKKSREVHNVHMILTRVPLFPSQLVTHAHY